VNEQVASLYAEVGVKIGNALSGLKQFRSRLQDSQSGLKTMRDQAKITGAAIDAALTAPIALLGKTALGMIGDYQKAMNVFQLVTKASAAEMQAAGEAINAVAHDLALPQFSKADAAEALVRLAQAGLGATGAIEALRPALLLAAAGEVEAAAGADLLGNSIKTWGLRAADAGKVADMLAATIKFGGVSFDQLRNTVEIAGATFAQAKVPMDVFLTLVGELGQAGIKGSEAGTALRNMLQSLIAPTGDAGGLLRALGVHVYDAQNQMRPFTAILGDLHDAFARLTPAQQEQYAATIFGREQMGAALAIIRGGLPAYDDMHEKVTTVGIAQELAKTKAEGLAGATADLSREVKNASTSALEPMAADLAVLAHGAADALRAFQKLPAPVQEIVGAVALLLPLLAALNLAWTVLGPAIGLVAAAVGALAGVLEPLALVVGGIAVGPLSLFILAVGGLALALKWAYDNVGPFHDAVDATFRMIDDLGQRASAAIRGFNDAFARMTGLRVDFGQIFLGIPIVGQIIEIYNRLKALGLLPGLGGSVPSVNVGGGGSSGGGAQGFVNGVPVGNGNGGRMAAGGSVTAGSAYTVGERGPELFVPDRGGSIVPNDATTGGRSYVINFNGPVYADDIEDVVVRALEQANRAGRTT
jgi:TP901 family phage tail tape measure protein